MINAVLAPDLTADLGVGPSGLGLLTATYFITFAAFQLPWAFYWTVSAPAGLKQDC